QNKFFSLIVIGVVGMSSVASPPAWSATFNEIQARGKLVVGVKDNLRPLGFRDATGNLQGLEIDIAKRLAEELLGKADAVVLQPVKNIDRLNVVIEDKVDLAIARVTQNESRLRIVDLSRPYYIDGTSLITKEASVKQVSDLSTKAIAVLKSSSTIAVIKYALPTAKLVGVNSYQEARTLLENGTASAFAADASILTGWVQDYPQYRLLPAKLSSEALCIVMPKGLQYTALQERVNQAILRWQASGWLAERVAAWGLP
ncbi:MAG: transporter substrate-binding domain-containing protein, partial [Coleofasciculaceae cyanobacterium]